MAVINGKTEARQNGVLVTTWVLPAAGDVGTPEQLSRYPLKSVQFGGTFGGATVVLEGSDDGVTYATLKAISATTGTTDLVSATAAARFDLENVPLHVRPARAGGAGAEIVVTLTSRMNFGR